MVSPPGATRPAAGRWLLRGLVDLWQRARRERSSPRKVALSVGLGAFAATSPFVGFHIWIALGLATVFRCSRLWAAIGSRLSTFPMLTVMAFVEIEVAHRVRTGGWVPLAFRDTLSAAKELYGDWLLGTLLVGPFIAAGVAAVTYAVACRFDVPAR